MGLSVSWSLMREVDRVRRGVVPSLKGLGIWMGCLPSALPQAVQKDGWPSLSARFYTWGAQSFSPSFGERVGTIFTRSGIPIRSLLRPVHSDSISTTPSTPVA